MTTKRKEKPAAAKHECEIGYMRSCTGRGVLRLTGPKKGDPVFWCCLACEAELRRAGAKLKEV